MVAIGVALGFLLVVHVMLVVHVSGHVFAARLRGVCVDRLRVGFGPVLVWKSIWSVTVEIRLIPFGAGAAISGRPLALRTLGDDNKPPLKPVDRLIIALGGPVSTAFISVLPALVLWGVGIQQQPSELPVVVADVPETFLDAGNVIRPVPEFAAGLQPGDVIESINGDIVNGWREVPERIVYAESGLVRLGVRRGEELIAIEYKTVANPAYEGLGMPFFVMNVPCEITGFSPDSPGHAAGLELHDKILTIGGKPILNPDQLASILHANGSQPMSVAVERQGNVVNIPNITTQFIDGRYLLGVQLSEIRTEPITIHLSPLEQYKAFISRKTQAWRASREPSAAVEARHMSGPVGVMAVLMLLPLSQLLPIFCSLTMSVCLELTILTLLPLPLADGGQLIAAMLQPVMGKRIAFILSRTATFLITVILLRCMDIIRTRSMCRTVVRVYWWIHSEPCHRSVR